AFGSAEDRGVAIVVLPDHHLRILVATSPSSSSADGAVVGLLSDGTIDASFGLPSTPGIVTLEGAYHAVPSNTNPTSPVLPDTPSGDSGATASNPGGIHSLRELYGMDVAELVIR